MTKKELITKNNVNIQPLMESLVELVKDKKATGELDDLINARLPEKTSAERKKSNPPPRNKMEQATDEAWSRGRINPGDCFHSIFFWKSWVEFWFGTA